MEKETFASRFKEAREKKCVTIKSMIPAIGVSPSAMNNYATGKTIPPLDVALKIAEYLGVSLDWLVGRDFNLRAFRCLSCSDAIRYIDELERCFAYTELGVEMRNSEGKYLVHFSIESKLLYDFYAKILEMNRVQKSLPKDLSSSMEPIIEAAQQRLIDEVLEKQNNVSLKETGLSRI